VMTSVYKNVAAKEAVRGVIWELYSLFSYGRIILVCFAS
jgi:hypothetical protein